MDPAGAVTAGLGLILLSGMVQVLRIQTSGGHLERNCALGIRTKATKASDSAWLAGHRAAGPWLQAATLTGYGAAVVSLGSSLVLLTVREQSAVPLVVALTGCVAVVVLLLVSTGKANEAARATEES